MFIYGTISNLAFVGGRRDAYRIVVGRPEGKRPLE